MDRAGTDSAPPAAHCEGIFELIYMLMQFLAGSAVVL
jgi:hypothetical protein